MKKSNEQFKRKGIMKKLVFSILGIFLLTILVGLGYLYSIVTSINKEYKSEETILGKGEKTALLIYEPSNTDSAKEISLSVAQIMIENGYTVTINFPSQELNYDLEKYDVIAFGSPIYMGKVSPVLKKYVKRNSIENKKLLLYAMGSAPADNTNEIDEMNSWISANNNIVKTKCIINEKANFESFVKKTITDWEVR